MANLSVCGKITVGQDVSCSTVPFATRYYQQIVVMNFEDINRATLVRPTTNGLTTHRVTFNRISATTAVTISAPNGGFAIFGKYAKSVDDYGIAKYVHMITFPTFGISEADKVRLTQLDKGLFVVAAQALDGTVEIYGLDNGLQTADYERDITASGGGTSMILQTNEKTKEMFVPYNYFSVDPNANFNNLFI